MFTPPRISVVIPTYNRYEVLAECLLAVSNQTYKNLQVIVMDDGRTSAAEQMVKSLTVFPEVEYQRNARTLGLPGNKNAALSKVTGDLVMILDDDSIIEPDCIERLVSAYTLLRAEGKRVGAIGPAMVFQNGNGQSSSVLSYGIRSMPKSFSAPCVKSGLTGLVYEDFSPGNTGLMEVIDLHANSMYPVSLIRSLGGYDANSYQGSMICEESDLHARIRRAGYHLYFEPRAVFLHKLASSGGCRVRSVRYAYYFLRNQWIYTVKYGGWRAFYQVPAQVVALTISGLRMYILYVETKVREKRIHEG